MIQILGLRPYTDTQGKQKLRDSFFDRNVVAKDILQIFQNPAAIVDEFPIAERYNLFFTVAYCTSEKRKLKRQEALPIDIDAIGDSDPMSVLKIAVEALGLSVENVCATASGNGVQFFIFLKIPIEDELYFNKNRAAYRLILAKIKRALVVSGLNGVPDPSVFSPARLMRLPNTENRKPDKGIKRASVLSACPNPRKVSLDELTGVGEVDSTDQIEFPSRFCSVDSKGVEEGCLFLAHTKKNQAQTSEPQWYAGLSIIGRLENGHELAHEYSKNHPNYDQNETDAKMDHAISSAGPRTCQNISTLWGGCRSCSNFGKVSSPIKIRRNDFIATAKSGFRKPVFDSKGGIRPGKIAYEDLAKQYEIENVYVVLAESNQVFIYVNHYWQEQIPKYRHAYVHEKALPKPSKNEALEFEHFIGRTHITSQRDWLAASAGKLNLENGVYDFGMNQLVSPSPEYFFTSKHNYAYDPQAKAPKIEKFLDEIACGDKKIVQVLLEFIGYALFNTDYCFHKALNLIGSGSNGKSTFIDLCRFLFGPGYFANISIGKISDPNSAVQLQNKKVNFSEETPSTALLESDNFKLASSGGYIQMKHLYKDVFSAPNIAKFILLSNSPPRLKDASHGMLRRLIIVPFNATFSGSSIKTNLRDDLVTEASGFLNLVVAAYRDLLQRGEFTLPDQHHVLLREFAEDGDPVLAWVNNRLEIFDLPSVERAYTADLHDDFISFLSSQTRFDRPLSLSHFGQRLSTHIPQYSARRWNDSTQRGISGVRLKPKPNSEY